MSNPTIHPGKRRWDLLCAVFLLVAMALSIVHAASPHCQATHECLACRSLHSPAIAQTDPGVSRPLPPTVAGIIEESAPPLIDRSPLLKPLRAPPSSSTI